MTTALSNAFNIVISSVTALPPNGKLITSQGIWSFGTNTNAPGNFALLLNGVNTGGGFGAKLKIQSGNLYTLTASSLEYKWNSSTNSWSKSSDPVTF